MVDVVFSPVSDWKGDLPVPWACRRAGREPPYGNLKSIDKNGIITVILSDLKKDACINDDGSISFEDKERLKNNYIYKRDKYK